MERTYSRSVAQREDYAGHLENLADANMRPRSKGAGLFGGISDLIQPPYEFGGAYGYGGHSSWGYPLYGNVGHGAGRYGTYGMLYGGHGGYGHHGGSRYHAAIAACQSVYDTNGIVRTVVTLLADFATEKVQIIDKDKAAQNFYNAWSTKIGLQERLNRFVIDLLNSGQVFIWRREAKLKDPDKRAMKKGRASEQVGNSLVVHVGDRRLKEGNREHLIEVECDNILSKLSTELAKYAEENAAQGKVTDVAQAKQPKTPLDIHKGTKIPWGYISLNPLQIEARGNKFADENYWVMKLHKDDLRPLSKYLTYTHHPHGRKTKINLPPEFKNKLKKTQSRDGRYAVELELDEKKLSVIHDASKKDYEDWALPSIFPALKEIYHKETLKAGEQSAMESLKHMITLIKVGDTKGGFGATDQSIQRIADMLAGGSQGHYLVWDDLIDGQILQPKVDKIFDPKKYEQVDKDIFVALGVSKAIMEGKGSFANSFLTIKLLLEKLETIRGKLKTWLMKELKIIADRMNFKSLPVIKFGRMSLRDENAEKKLALGLWDRGVLSRQALLEGFGEDFDIELARQKMEAEVVVADKTSEIMEKRGPFIKKPGDLGGFGKSPKKPAPGKEDSEEPGEVGRPSVTKEIKQEEKRDTKPKGLSRLMKYEEIKEIAETRYDWIASALTNQAVEKHQVRDVRSLDKTTKAELERLTAAVLSRVDPNKPIDIDLVYKIVRDLDLSGDGLQPSVGEIYVSELHKEGDTKAQRRNLICAAYAMHWSKEENDGENSGVVEEGS